MRLLLKTFLEFYPVNVEEASNGMEALAKIEELEPDLLIIDYSMPHMTGLQVVQELDGRIPSIIITSEGFTEETEKKLRESASLYLVKPVTEEVLVNAVESVTGKKISIDELK